MIFSGDHLSRTSPGCTLPLPQLRHVCQRTAFYLLMGCTHSFFELLRVTLFGIFGVSCVRYVPLPTLGLLRGEASSFIGAKCRFGNTRWATKT